MPRRIQPTAIKARRHHMVCMTDSLTDPTMNMGLEATRWTEGLRRRLESVAGARIIVHNLAQSGARTDDGGITGGTGKQMLARSLPFPPSFLTPPNSPLVIPDIVSIWGGPNDFRTVTSLTSTGTTATVNIPAHGLIVTGQTLLGEIYGASPAGYNVQNVVFSFVDANNLSYTVPGGLTSPATGTIIFRTMTKANLRAMVKWVRFGCRGAYRSQADLPLDAMDGDRYVILNDTSTTGGIAAYASQQWATITGSATAGDPTVWEYRHNKAGEAGWGRIAVAGTAYDAKRGCNRIIMPGAHYLNYSSGGDTLATPYAPYDDVTGLRRQQIDAAAAEGVVYADTYTYFRNRIVNGLDVQGDLAWHIANGNQHFSEYGQALMTDFMYGIIAAQTGWLAAISS